MPDTRRTAVILCAAVTVLLAGGTGAAARGGPRGDPTVTHGVIVGDVTASSALLWARADQEATLNVVLSAGRHRERANARAHAEEDYTARAPVLRRRRAEGSLHWRPRG
jgi:alkaline phosphatase D